MVNFSEIKETAKDIWLSPKDDTNVIIAVGVPVAVATYLLAKKAIKPRIIYRKSKSIYRRFRRRK
jgi:hypothetical protein